MTDNDTTQSKQGNVILDMTTSLDGFIAGPNDEPGGLHDWYFAPSDSSDTVINELNDTIGALVMGRRTYDVGNEADGFVNNPYSVTHFVLTHESPETAAKGETTFVFVTDGIESVLQQAKAAAGDKNVVVEGGANTARQFIQAGVLDELRIHLVPILLGDGIRLFENIDTDHIELERTRVIESPEVTHLRFRVGN